jgi:biopolymer transport protein ExbD
MSHRHRTETVHKSKRKLDDVRSDINVTPLVDVCLVLLIIFMVVLDKLARGKDVPLPKTQNHETLKDNSEDLIISISKDGARTQVWWDRDALRDEADFKKRLEEESRRKNNRPMFLKADADLKYGDVYPVLMTMHAAGAEKIMLSTQELKEK